MQYIRKIFFILFAFIFFSTQIVPVQAYTPENRLSEINKNRSFDQKISVEKKPEIVTNTHDYSNGEWVISGSMNYARQWHTATLLLDGKVLVAGGQDFSSSLSSAELYDPSTRFWYATDSMETARYHHTSILLPDGKVLVSGGQNNTVALASSEIFNPDTDLWENTGSMNSPRTLSTATLLPNGKVLVVGGCSGVDCHTSSYLASAELYDPNTGSWTATGSMNSERASHTATLLSNGKVLVTGGAKDYGTYFKTLNTAELYDPDTGTWESVASMNSERETHTATLLTNGKVLVVGGRTIIYFYGQCNWNFSTIASAELYDPATDTWELTNSMNNVRHGHTATLLMDGNVLVTGGHDYVDICGVSFHALSLSTTEIFDSDTGVWQYTNSLNNSRTDFTATLLNSGSVLVAGGYYEPPLTSVISGEIYDQPPISVAGSDQDVDTLSLVTLDGSGSSDPDEDTPLTYLWTQTGGPVVTLDDPTASSPTFTAPSYSTSLTFSLVISDSVGLSSQPDEVVITVNTPKEITCSDITEIPQTECEALIDLYANTDGNHWTNNTNWLINTTPSDWYGITIVDNHVTQIQLQSNNLSGTIPPSIENLTYLNTLLLVFNSNLIGSIPIELGNLRNLVYLYLIGNNLNGEIPLELGNLSNLEELFLGTNQFSGPIPPELGNLNSLNKLWISGNQFSGSIPPELGNLKNLKELAIGFDYNLSGTIPSEIGKLTNLTYFSVSATSLSGSIPTSIIRLKKLNNFHFQYTSICEPSNSAFLKWKYTVEIWLGSGYTCQTNEKN